MYSIFLDAEPMSHILWPESVYGGGRSGTKTLSAIAHIEPKNSPTTFSKIRGTAKSWRRGESKSLIWFSITTEGTLRNLAATSGESLLSESTISGLHSSMLRVSWLTCLEKFANQRGIFAMLSLTENPPSMLQANSTGGTVAHLYPLRERYLAASPYDENFIFMPSLVRWSATITRRLACPSPTPYGAKYATDDNEQNIIIHYILLS